jgi:hypothetical protein
MSEPITGTEVLDEAITKVINRVVKEWDLSTYQALGVLAVISARLAHRCVEHEEDCDGD